MENIVLFNNSMRFVMWTTTIIVGALTMAQSFVCMALHSRWGWVGGCVFA